MLAKSTFPISPEDLIMKTKRVLAANNGGRGLHSSTFQLNLSALYGIGGARRACVARTRDVRGVYGV